jgi:large subunit ribosomal protein L21e
MPGDLVAIFAERSEKIDFPKRLQGRTGVVVGKRGRANIVKIKDQTKEKEFIIKSIHLKKIKPMEKKK